MKKQRIFHLLLRINLLLKINLADYMNEMKSDSYTACTKLICDWTDKKNYLVHYRMLKFYVKHGMIVEKVHEVISL